MVGAKYMPETLIVVEPNFRRWMAFPLELSLLNGQRQFGQDRTVNDVTEVFQSHDRGSVVWSNHVRTGEHGSRATRRWKAQFRQQIVEGLTGGPTGAPGAV